MISLDDKKKKNYGNAVFFWENALKRGLSFFMGNDMNFI